MKRVVLLAGLLWCQASLNLTSMSSLTEIESAVAALPRVEKVRLMDSLKRMIETPDRALKWPVPPPNVRADEIDRIQARIDAAFSKLD